MGTVPSKINVNNAPKPKKDKNLSQDYDEFDFGFDDAGSENIENRTAKRKAAKSTKSTAMQKSRAVRASSRRR
jgi:hypothetical protein